MVAKPLTKRQMEILRAVDELKQAGKLITHSALAEAIGAHRQNIPTLIGPLVRAGYLIDGSIEVTPIKLTRKGREQL